MIATGKAPATVRALVYIRIRGNLSDTLSTKCRRLSLACPQPGLTYSFEGEASPSIYNLLIGKAALNFLLFILSVIVKFFGLARKATAERGGHWHQL